MVVLPRSPASFPSLLLFETGPGVIGWYLPLTAEFLAKLGEAETVHFDALSRQKQTARVFPIAGLAKARLELLKCTTKSQPKH